MTDQSVQQRLSQLLSQVPLRWMLVVPFVLQTVGAVALVGFLSYRSGQKAVENLANQLLRQTSERVSDRLTNYLEHSQQVVESNQLEVKQGTLNLDNLEQLRRQLWQQINLNPSLPSIGFWNDRGMALVYGKVASEAEKDLIYQQTKIPAPIGTLYLSEISPGLRRYLLIDAQGNPKKQILVVKEDFRQTPWYLQAKVNNQQHWAPIFITQMASHLVMRAVAPISDPAGNFQGLFTSYYALSQISTFLHGLRFSPNGQVFIVERSGDLVATSILSESSALQRVNGRLARLSALESQNEYTRAVAKQLLQQSGSLHDLNSVQQLNLRIKGKRQFVQITPYQDRYGLDWLVVTVIPESDFMSEIRAQNGWTFLLCCITLLATTTLGLLTARHITNPLHRLNISAQKIAQNDFDHEVPVGGLGEVKQLSQTFQQMAEQLRLSLQLRTNYEQQLQQQVAEQTAELAKIKDLREAIFNESTDAIFLVEPPPTNRILDCNQRAVELFEVESKAELIGIQGSTLQKQPYREDELADIAVELEQKGFWSREIEYITITGRTFWANLAVKPISVAGQKTMRLVRLTDISERKQLEAQLRRTEQWLQQFSRQAPSSIYTFVHESDGHLWFEYVSSAVETIHEVTQAQVLENAYLILDHMHPDDRAGYAAAVARSVETLDVFRYEWRIITPSGKLKWLQAISQPERRSHGAIAWHGVVQDMTERKQVEESLCESEERFRLAFENAAIGIALVAPSGDFLRVNQALCEMLGYSEAELLARSFQDVSEPTDLERDLELLQQVLTGERRTYQLEKRYIHQRGTVIWTLLSVSLVRDGAGQPLYFVSQIQDISDRQEISRMKDEFIAIVTHELRTPLTSIRASLGLLASGVLDDEPETAQRMLQVAAQSSDRLVRLVNDILNLERLESGKVQLIRQPCSVGDLMHQAIAAVDALAIAANVTLAMTSLEMEVQAAPDAIVQTLINLLSNAIKFSPAGGTVWLKAEIQSPNILFSVTDHGRGIPSNQLEAVFGRFQQVDTSDAREKGGTGLGLAICKNIVQQHGGQIWVESELNYGSTFYFTLPIAKTE